MKVNKKNWEIAQFTFGIVGEKSGILEQFKSNKRKRHWLGYVT